MKKYRWILWLLVLSLLLGGCGGAAANGSGAYYRTEAAATEAAEDSSLNGGETGSSIELPVNQKLIRKVWLDVETNDMEALLKTVEEKIVQLGGYVENRQIQNASISSAYRHRYGSLTVRIPAEKLDSFISDMDGVSNIVSNKETTEDVTLSYVENESRVKALETEQTRLLELLAKAETMDDILQIESRLTDIRGELEAVKGTLRVYDNLVNYSTVYLDIDEVVEYTEPEPETLVKSWKNMVRALGNFLVFLVVALPYLLPFAVVIAVIVLLVKLSNKKKAKKKQPPKAE